MTAIKNQKISLVAIAAIATMLAVSTISIGHGRTAFAAETITVTKHVNSTGVNLQTDTNQPQTCQTVGANSPLSGSCIANSNNHVNESGGILKK